jgi:hypothetical protein
MKKSNVIARILALTIIISPHVYGIDNPHFWRATNFLTAFYEPRLARNWLTSFDATIGYGSTHKSRNDICGMKVPLLDIYGVQNMQALGINVPGKDLTNPGDILLTQLALLPINDGFGKLSYSGKFTVVEANLCFSQNLMCGFFVQGHMPVRRLSVSDIIPCDLSPTDCTNGPNQFTPTWQAFLTVLPTIFEKYGISPAPTRTTGVGDISFLGGWTNNYEDTREIDYFDTTFRIGILFPTGKTRNEDLAFSIPNGYNGFYAIPASFDAAAGWYDWFTLGVHFGAMAFIRKDKNLRMRTDCAQSGFIKLAKGHARVDPGTIWEINAYTKADHLICGFSFLVAYSFANKDRDIISPCDLNVFTPTIVNNDQMFLGWKMHTINFIAEWDFATYECPWYPRVGGFFNLIVGGRRIFNTNVGGFQIGIDFASDF